MFMLLASHLQLVRVTGDQDVHPQPPLHRRQRIRAAPRHYLLSSISDMGAGMEDAIWQQT